MMKVIKNFEMKGKIMSLKAVILGGSPVIEKSIPFARPTLPLFEELEDDFRSIIESGMITKGKFLKEFENQLKISLGVPYALGVSNCTTGLFMLIKALGLKGEVIVPSFSFMASFHAVEIAGLAPVFVDCEMDTFTIDPVKIEEAITDRTSAIMGVNIFGNPPDIKAIENIAKKHNLKFFVDSAHSFGTRYMGQLMGKFGDGEAFSTSATKLLATGEGGVVTTCHENIYEFIKAFREYGNTGDYDCAVAGVNGRMSEFHALLGLKLLPRVEKFAENRNLIAQFYQENLKDFPGIIFQKIRNGCRSSYKDFAILIDEVQFGLNRDQLIKALGAEGIGARKYFSPPGHKLKVYEKYTSSVLDDMKNTNYIASRTVILPIYSHMTTELAGKVVEAVKRIYHCRKKIAQLDIGEWGNGERTRSLEGEEV